MSWKVLITARTMNEVGVSALQLLRDASCDLVIPPNPGPFSADELLELLQDVDGVLASMDKFTAAVLESSAAAKLKIISRWGQERNSHWTTAEKDVVLQIKPLKLEQVGPP